MSVWKVIKRDNKSYISPPIGVGKNKESLLFLRLEFGDVSTNFSSHDSMQMALYDEYQCNEFLKDGDVINTPVGNFYCSGVHVLSQTEKDG